MRTRVERRTVDLSSYPDLVVIYLGMRVNRMCGIKTLFGFGPKISSSASAQPDGLLRHENIIYSLFPLHLGMRQYWRDTDSLLNWTRSDPHRQWEGLGRNAVLADASQQLRDRLSQPGEPIPSVSSGARLLRD